MARRRARPQGAEEQRGEASGLGGLGVGAAPVGDVPGDAGQGLGGGVEDLVHTRAGAPGAAGRPRRARGRRASRAAGPGRSARPALGGTAFAAGRCTADRDRQVAPGGRARRGRARSPIRAPSRATKARTPAFSSRGSGSAGGCLRAAPLRASRPGRAGRPGRCRPSSTAAPGGPGARGRRPPVRRLARVASQGRRLPVGAGHGLELAAARAMSGWLAMRADPRRARA